MLDQENMKSKNVMSRIGLISKTSYFWTWSSVHGCYHARCMDVFVEDERACSAGGAVHFR